MSPPAANAPQTRLTGRDGYALAFGLFLGLAIVKFGNPVILDQNIQPPASLSDVWNNAWPSQWGVWMLGVLALVGIVFAPATKMRWPQQKYFWLLPLLWFGWQLVSAAQSVDRKLTDPTLWHFAGCVACYFVGAIALGNERALRWLMAGLLVAFAFCLVRAVNQRIYEFPRDLQFLKEGERTGWTNCPADTFAQLKRERLIISTNGLELANPAIVKKLESGRVYGTLFYPNALASVILLLGPVAIALAVKSSRRFRSATRASIIVLTLLLIGLGLFWTGSKSGWLIALALGGACFLKLRWSARWKWTVLLAIGVVGLAVFAFRFHGYFASGAKSVGARFDYWRAAVEITQEHPLFGTGPGTFQRPYEHLKPLDAEMARLAHNDYLEQFCDSGVPGGIAYALWIGTMIVTLARRVWRTKSVLSFTVFIGLCGWFAQGFAEFELYVPALAWTSFALLGLLFAASERPFDKMQSPS